MGRGGVVTTTLKIFWVVNIPRGQSYDEVPTKLLVTTNRIVHVAAVLGGGLRVKSRSLHHRDVRCRRRLRFDDEVVGGLDIRVVTCTQR